MATKSVSNIRGTREHLGKTIRQQWLTANNVECEPLTFGDLDVGDRFILFPEPGDNHGHGGLLHNSYVFLKTDFLDTKNPHWKFAVKLSDGNHFYFGNNVFVVRIT